jgi:hypothetical protein
MVLRPSPILIVALIAMTLGACHPAEKPVPETAATVVDDPAAPPPGSQAAEAIGTDSTAPSPAAPPH